MSCFNFMRSFKKLHFIFVIVGMFAAVSFLIMQSVSAVIPAPTDHPNCQVYYQPDGNWQQICDVLPTVPKPPIIDDNNPPVEPPVVPPTTTPPPPATPPTVPKPPSILDFYANPLRNISNIFAARIDMGVDYKGTGPVMAIGKAKVTVATTHSRFWGRSTGNVVVYELLEGPAKGKSVFVSEYCTPLVKVGQIITTATTVCRMYGGTEMGWAEPGGSDKPAAWYTQYVPAGYKDGTKTAYGVNFDALMLKLGALGGNTHAGYVSYNPQKTVGQVPASYPTWK